MTSNKKEHPLQTFAKLVHDHRKGIIGTLAVVFAAFLLSVGTVYVSDSGLQGSFARSRASRAGLTEAKPAKSLSYVSCRDTDMENDPTVGGTVTIVGVVGPDRQYLSQKDTCRENVNTEYKCNTAIFKKAGGKVKKTDIPEDTQFWDEAGSGACASGCGGDDRCLGEEDIEREAQFNRNQRQGLDVDVLVEEDPVERGRGPIPETYAGAQNVLIAAANIVAHNEDIAVRHIDISLAGINGGLIMGSSSTRYFSNLRLVRMDTNELLSGPNDYSGPHTLLHGATSINAGAATAYFTLFFNQPLIIPAETSIRVGIFTDIEEFPDHNQDLFLNEDYAVVFYQPDWGYHYATDGEPIPAERSPQNLGRTRFTVIVRVRQLLRH